MTFLGEEEIRSLLHGFDIVTLDEEEYDGAAFSGAKHWHTFHLMARRSLN